MNREDGACSEDDGDNNLAAADLSTRPAMKRLRRLEVESEDRPGSVDDCKQRPDHHADHMYHYVRADRNRDEFIGNKQTYTHSNLY